MNYRILKVKNDIELFLKDNIEHQNKHIDYIMIPMFWQVMDMMRQ